MEFIANYKAVRERLYNPPNAYREPAPLIVDKPKPEPPPPPPPPPMKCMSVLPPRMDYGTNSTVDEVIRAVCIVFDVSGTNIRSMRRTADVMKPRHVAMALCRRLTLKSLPEIGRRMGGKDHTTVLHGCKKPFIMAAIAAVAPAMGDSLDPMEWAQAIRDHLAKP